METWTIQEWAEFNIEALTQFASERPEYAADVEPLIDYFANIRWSH